MKKKIIPLFVIIVLFAAAAPIVYNMINTMSVKAEEEGRNKAITDKLVSELEKERAIFEKEKQKLQQQQSYLKNYEAQLDQKLADYLQKAKDLEDREKEFKAKVESLIIDRQTLETYESIDPEQSALLLIKLYEKDKILVNMLMRKITGKKAGKILEAMVPVDRETAARISEDTLNYFKPKNQKIGTEEDQKNEDTSDTTNTPENP